MDGRARGPCVLPDKAFHLLRLILVTVALPQPHCSGRPVGCVSDLERSIVPTDRLYDVQASAYDPLSVEVIPLVEQNLLALFATSGLIVGLTGSDCAAVVDASKNSLASSDLSART